MREQKELAAAPKRQRRFFAANDEDVGDIGELEVAEYIIHLLALDTYIRYVEEFTGEEDPIDDVISKGMRVMRAAESELDNIRGFLDEHLPGQAHKTMLKRALRKRVTNPAQIGRRALQLRTLLELGGSKTKRAIFQKNKLLKQIRDGVSASMMEDADAALDIFAAIAVRNARIRAWIDLAAKTAGSGEEPQNLILTSVQQTADKATEMLATNVQEEGATAADEVMEAKAAQHDKIEEVQRAATQAAQEAMDRSGEPDVPLTKSEVIGVAVAAATAATSDPTNPSNVPEPLKFLDDEQRAAALTDGRVLIAAGAGSGKSTTLVARCNYLLRDRRADPERMMVTSFNTKAAKELEEKLGKAAGSAAPKHVGTMHSLFGRMVKEYGNGRERAAMQNYKKTESYTTRAVQAIWKDCYADEETPSAKKMKLAKTQWSGNRISPQQAMEMALESGDKKMVQAARWYEMYEGLKGAFDLPNEDGVVVSPWRPPCEDRAKAAVEEVNDDKMDQWRSMGSNPRYRPKPKQTIFEAYMANVRPQGSRQRVADFDDMLGICHDILERNPGARKAIQSRFDHILVDECQDLNEVQHGVIRMMTEHITDGKDGKSLWMVGDDKQSIYAFRGARPDLFTGLHGKEGWKTRMMRTNYRCAPEIVEHANKLIAHNEGQIPMQANPSPGKTRGTASIQVQTPRDDAGAAIQTVEEIKVRSVDMADTERPKFYSENAVLCRTNKELHAYETACIIRGIPYARKGSGSFLGSRETSAMLGYTTVVMGGDDPKKVQAALANCINEPNRFYTGTKTPDKVEDAVRDYAKKAGIYIKDVDPSRAIHDRAFQEALAGAFGGRPGSWKYKQALEKIRDMAATVQDLQANLQDPDYTTRDLFDGILGGFEGEDNATDDKGVPIKVSTTLRESLLKSVRDYSNTGDEGDEEGDEEDEIEQLGNIQFLYMLMEPDPTDEEDMAQSPQTPAGFAAKMARFERKAADLRIDLNEWDDKQAKLPPEQRSKPPAVYLGTVHSVKGAEWPNTYVQMPKGKFPFEPPPPKEGEPPKSDEELQKAYEELETERRLAYVALTRASEKLTVICPDKVGGKAAGVSQFVTEAGMSIGENVGRPEGADPDPVPLPTDPMEALRQTFRDQGKTEEEIDELLQGEMETLRDEERTNRFATEADFLGGLEPPDDWDNVAAPWNPNDFGEGK